MATVKDVKELLRNVSAATVGEKVNDAFPITIRSTQFMLAEADVNDYLSIRGTVSVDPETAIFIPGYYEQAVDILSPGTIPGIYRLGRRDEPIHLRSQNGQVEIDLSRISTRFVLTLLDRIDRQSIPQIRYPRHTSRVVADRHLDLEEQLQFREIFRSVQTVKVFVSPKFRSSYKQHVLKSIAEAGLFNISYSRKVGLILSRSWERGPYRLRGVKRFEDIQFPRKTYNSDLVAHYQLALSSDSLVLTYLSLYKILEYFFISTAETVLHGRLRDKLSVPDFSHSRESELRKLVSLVRKFDQRTDEQRMLTHVIENYFMPDEISGWITEHESEQGQYFTVPQTVFGTSYKVDLNPDKVSSSLAKRIYYIRNVLVHHKADLPRFMPFTGHEDVLLKELPIVMFLAEQLIVKTGDDI